MPITKEDIREYLEYGIEKAKYNYMVVMCDTFDFDDYPVYTDDPEKYIKESMRPESMARVMEVYNLNMDIETQLNQHRAWNL